MGKLISNIECCFYRTQVSMGSNLWVQLSLTNTPFWNLNDEDTNSILTDNANRAIQGNVANFGINASGAIWWPNLQPMQVAPSVGQFCNYAKWHHLVAKFVTNAYGARHDICQNFYATAVLGARILRKNAWIGTLPNSRQKSVNALKWPNSRQKGVFKTALMH